MTDRCDVLIIGAGPAGSSSAALAHQAGLSAVVVEKQRFPRFVIGESLLPRCMDLLAEAGLLDAVAARNYLVKRGALFLRESERSDFSFGDQHTLGWDYTWQVPRADFDQTLANAVAARGVPFLFEHEVKGVDVTRTHPRVTIAAPGGEERNIEARFVIDASGYGRVLPRLLDLDAPSRSPMRKAVFAHVRGEQRPSGPDAQRIWIIVSKSGGWLWIIPFSNGLTSVGIVGDDATFARFPDPPDECLRAVIDTEPNCLRLRAGEWALEPRAITGYSCAVKKLYGDNFCLVGNATEFLDPVFSSGVTLALESANRATKCVIRQLRGDAVAWEAEYAAPMALGTDVFRSFVNNWYSGVLPELIFSLAAHRPVKNKICSVLAGYVWDETNPFVSQHERKLEQIYRVIAGQA